MAIFRSSHIANANREPHVAKNQQVVVANAYLHDDLMPWDRLLSAVNLLDGGQHGGEVQEECEECEHACQIYSVSV
jgi:hypothetical protein